ncbi:MAG: MFS transporter [Ottowia sp.]|nr:MFS transporter [Ottowia sp.]
MDSTQSTTLSWANAFRVYLEATTWKIFALGFAAGLPLVLVLGTLSFRLREAGIDRATVGYLSWIGLVYGFKWVWAPLVDRVPIPLLRRMGRRRSWLLLSQLLIVGGLVGMGITDPKLALSSLVVFALLVAFGSATQDIALDALRIESAGIYRQAALASAYQTGYRLAMIWAGAGALWIATLVEAGSSEIVQNTPWEMTYLVMAASMLIGITVVLFSKEPAQVSLPAAKNFAVWFYDTLVGPFADFFKRFRWQAVLLLLLIGIYRISDIVMGVMANPFYVDMGFTKLEVASVSKVYGVIMTLIGAFVGGALSMRVGVTRVLLLGAVLSAASNLLFAWLSGQGHDVNALIWVISADNLSSGIASAAFIAYLSSLTSIHYSATQYALFSSLMLLLPKLLAGYSGVYVDAFGYNNFFMATACLGIPAIILVLLAHKLHK